MTKQLMQFSYSNIELLKSESLGSGSYGGVCKAKCDGLLCAAKIMHPTLFDKQDPGSASYLCKFREECHLLSLARHPNVVQYLATSQDPDTQLPVLLMELCEESLTAFLERSPGPLPYHIQVNICHDIALGLVYLHSNGVIHRDLTGNNILMMAGPRAKITDFGMSKLARGNVRMTAMTHCPGNQLYMSPEALDEATSYTAKLDIFSFGVLVIQILTRLFPNPTDRHYMVYVAEFNDKLKREVPEKQRRKKHLDLISDAHSLKPLAISCLTKELDRPSAMQLSENLLELKESPQYRESVSGAQMSDDVQQLQLQLRGQRVLTDAKKRELEMYQAQISALKKAVDNKDSELQAMGENLHEQQCIIQAKNEQIQEKDKELHEKNRQLQLEVVGNQRKEKEFQKMREQLQSSEHLVSEFQQSLHLKEKTISDLQQVMSTQERKMKQLELQQDTVSSRSKPQQQSATVFEKALQVVQKDISKMKWRKGRNAPEAMVRGAVVVQGNTAYIMPGGSHKVYSYQHVLGREQWSQMPQNPIVYCGLAIIDGFLTSVGGYSNDFTNTLLSLVERGTRKMWSEIFPPMPTARQNVACVTTDQALVVAGGYAGDSYLALVEVMNKRTKQWTTASSLSPLPLRCSIISMTICGDSLYLMGGLTEKSSPLKSVFTCSLTDIFPSSAEYRSYGVWREIKSLPVTGSTLVRFGYDLLAVGGVDSARNPTSHVYRYDSRTNSWNVASPMKNKRSRCLAFVFPEDSLIIVGGYTNPSPTDAVEMLK